MLLESGSPLRFLKKLLSRSRSRLGFTKPTTKPSERSWASTVEEVPTTRSPQEVHLIRIGSTRSSVTKTMPLSVNCNSPSGNVVRWREARKALQSRTASRHRFRELSHSVKRSGNAAMRAGVIGTDEQPASIAAIVPPMKGRSFTAQRPNIGDPKLFMAGEEAQRFIAAASGE